MPTPDERSPCCDAPLTMYDKGNGEKYLACYRCFKPVPAAPAKD